MGKYVVLLLVLVLTTMSLGDWDASWESLRSRPYPRWFKDAKLGVFIHWSVSSVPSYCDREQYSEWFLRGLDLGDTTRINFQERVYGEGFTYRDYAPLFKAELFDADEWADLFKRSGAKYIIFVTKHHDGYCLWPSEQAPGWNSVDVGPKRDVTGELAQAVRNKGIKFGAYYSLTEWNNPLHRWYTDEPKTIGKYVEQHMIPQFKDLVARYRPKIIFSDGEWFNQADDFHAKELISWYYNYVGDEAIVNNRWGGGSDIGFLTPEYSSGITETNRPWSEVRGLGRSFGLNRNEKLEAYMTPKDLIHFFIKAVANGGGITINVGPKADGQIPLLQQERLLKLGEWIHTNEEAVYASQAWKRTGESKEYTLKRVDSLIDFNWVRNSPGKPIKEDAFQVEWTGSLVVPETKSYRFFLEADDGARFWLEDRLVVNNWKEKDDGAEGNVMNNVTAVSDEGVVQLEKGRSYLLRLKFYESKRNAVIRLMWENNKGDKEPVPSQWLYTDSNLKTHGLKGVYRSENQYMCYIQNKGNLYVVSLEWPGRSLEIPIEKPENDTVIRLLGVDEDLSWEYRDGKIVVDVSHLTIDKLPSYYAWTFKIVGYAK